MNVIVDEDWAVNVDAIQRMTRVHKGHSSLYWQVTVCYTDGYREDFKGTLARRIWDAFTGEDHS